MQLPAIQVKGFKRLEVRRDGKLRYDSGWTPNLITNVGLESLGEGKSIAGWCAVGTGNSAPSITDVTLQTGIAFVAGSTAGQGVVTSGDRYGWQRTSYAFAQGAVVGNVAEVGVGWTASFATSVFSRSLVSPAISIISLDQLTVTYELRIYLPTTDVTGGPTNIGGVDYNWTVRPINANSNGLAGYASGLGWSHNLLALGAGIRTWIVPAFGLYPAQACRAPCILTPIAQGSIWTSTSVNATADFCDIGTNSAYAAASKQCNFTFKFSTARGNWAEGIQGVFFSGIFGTYQIIFSAAIPKDNTKELTLNFRQSWARRP